MKLARKSWKLVILLLLLTNYATVTAVASLVHDHDADLHFHEFCPACQWEVQSQEDSSDLLSGLTALLDPLVVVDLSPIVDFHVSVQQDAASIHPSRAPPTS